MKISVVITTFNEADIIGRTLDSVKGWADDILVVDSFSTDGTVEIVQAYGARLESRKYQGPANQKNWAIPKAKHEWVLLLDGDELVSPELKAEIGLLFSNKQAPEFDAYWIRRNNFFLGQAVRFSGWQGDKVVRFFHRDKARYNDVQVHEEIDIEGISVAVLSGRLDHYTFKSLDHYLAKTRRYASWSAIDHAERTPEIGLFQLCLKPLFRFIKHYFIQQGFRDGKIGFVVSAIMAWGVFLRYVYMLEKRSEEAN